MNVCDAIEDENLLGPWFAGPSWDAWKAVLKGAFAVPMSGAELATFRELAGGRDPPTKQVRELWIVAGRRAGKDSVASAIAAWAAAGTDYNAMLRPGETASVLCLACDRLQARIVSRYARSYFERNAMLKPLVMNETTDTISLSTGAELTVATNSFRGLRGRAVACAILDETAFWKSDDSANPDAEVYQAILPGLVTVPGSMLVAISSPYRRAGLLYRKWREHFGKSSDDVLVVHAATKQLNPTIAQSVIDDALEADPAAARAEWLAEWRDDLSSYISRELVEGAVDRGVIARGPDPCHGHVAFADPSGGLHDSFTIAIAHVENRVVFVDLVVEIKAPFDPTEATRRLAAELRGYRVSSLTGDKYAAQWVVSAFAEYGIRYVASERDRSAIYADALSLFTSGRVRLVDNKRLVNQLSSLERRTTSGGRDRIDHPANGADDVANAVCGALVSATTRRPMMISDRALELAGRGSLRWLEGQRKSHSMG
jgi:hypothetical protein